MVHTVFAAFDRFIFVFFLAGLCRALNKALRGPHGPPAVMVYMLVFNARADQR
jgi:hypothetical protein